MIRLTEWTGEEWIQRQEKLNGKTVGNRQCLSRLAEYENLCLLPEEIKPYIELVEKMNVCDFVRENKKLSDKIRFLEAKLN